MCIFVVHWYWLRGIHSVFLAWHTKFSNNKLSTPPLVVTAAQLAALYGLPDVVDVLTKGDDSETAEGLRRMACERRHRQVCSLLTSIIAAGWGGGGLEPQPSIRK
jgi:hypothetical protein